MKLVISEKQLKTLISQMNVDQDLAEQGEGEGAPESGTSSDGEKKTGATLWTSGATRGAYQLGVTKWADSYKITRGRANPLWEQEAKDLLTQILRPDGKYMHAPANTKILGVFGSDAMNGSKFINSLKPLISKEKGGLGNKQTEQWIPSDWSKIIKLNSVSSFITPDNIKYQAVFRHPKLQELAKNDPSARSFYAAYPEPNGWKFTGYYADGNPKPFVSIQVEKGFWEEWKYMILAGASIVAAIAIPGIGGIILSIGIDLFSAALQYAEGDTIGSGISVILAFIPVIGRTIPALKIPKEVAENLAKGLAPLKSEQEIYDFVKGLKNQQERYFLQKLLAEDPKKLTALIEKELFGTVTQQNAGNVVTKLNELIKNKVLDKVKAEKWYKSLGLRRFGFDIAASGLIIYGGIKVGDFLNKKAQEQALQGLMPSDLDIKIAELAIKVKNQDNATYSMVIAPIFEKYGQMYDVDDEAKLNKLRKIQLGVLETFLKDPNEDLEILADKLDKE